MSRVYLQINCCCRDLNSRVWGQYFTNSMILLSTHYVIKSDMFSRFHTLVLTTDCFVYANETLWLMAGKVSLQNFSWKLKVTSVFLEGSLHAQMLYLIMIYSCIYKVIFAPRFFVRIVACWVAKDCSLIYIYVLGVVSIWTFTSLIT